METIFFQIASQDPEAEEGDEEGGEEDEQAEYDAMLVENAGELIPTVAKIVGGETFAPFMAGLMPEIVKKTKSTSTTADKSFAVGTLADCVDAMGVTAAAFAPILYPIFMGMSKDEDEEVRSNACFALGVLGAKTGPSIHPKYPEIMQVFMDILTGEQNRRVVDNICAAFCRLIISHIDGVPMDSVSILIYIIMNVDDVEVSNSTHDCCYCTVFHQ